MEWGGAHPLAANKRKILEAARKLAQKGAKEKALKEYQRLLQLDPKDAKLRLEIGDAYRRWGQVDEAVDTYRKVAEQYMAEGFDARAVAVFKQILNLDPDRLEAYAPLAELYERMGLGAEAISALQTAADGYHRQGRKKEALEILRKMAHADPSNTTNRIKVADLLRQEGQAEDAMSEYRLAAEELERQGDVEMLGNVYRRMLETDASDVGALGALAANLAKRGKTAEAVPLAERALQLDDGEPERYETLASLYRKIDREDAAIGVYRRLAELYRQRGDEDTARGILQRHVPSGELSSDVDADAPDELSGHGLLDDGAGDGLFGDEFPDSDESPEIPLDFGADVDIRGRSGADAGSEPLMSHDTAGDSLDGSLFADAAAPSLELDEPMPPAPPAAPRAPAPAAADADPEQLLAEASVYLRYGKRDKAIAHLERVLDRDPSHRAALEKLGEACAAGGQRERAVEVWLRAAQGAARDGDADTLRVLRGRIGALDEAAAATLDGPAADAPDDDALDLDLAAGDDALDLDDELLDDEMDAIARAEPPAPERPEEPTRIDLDRDLGEALELDVDGESGADADPDVEVEIDLDDAFEAEVDAPAAAPAPASPSASTSLSLSAETRAKVIDDLDEADFYMQQGLLDEAEEIYRRVLTIAPSHPRAMVRLGEVAAARGESPRNTPAPVEVGDDVAAEGIELAADEIEAPEPAIAAGEDLEGLSDLDLPDADASPSALEDTTLEDESAGDGSDTEEFEPNLSSSEPPAAPAAGDGFDLAAALSDAFDDEPGAAGAAAADDDGFGAVFDAFKKGVRETLGDSDHQAHYDLAIAYKEMGLYDDAIHELRVAMGDAGRTAECLHLIGMCAIESDQAPLAVEHLEQLLALPRLGDDAQVAARYDLGRALRAVGDGDGARRAWEQVAAARPGFQDVAQLLEGLGAPETEEPTGGGFESFDDVIEALDDDAADDAPEPPADPGETFDDLVAEANEDDADELAAPEPPRPPRRRKKISFV